MNTSLDYMQDNLQASQASQKLLSSLSFCVIDLETTGGNPETEKIIEIGMVKIEQRKIVEERWFLINPEKEIPEFVQKLTGIKQSDVEHSPKIEEVIDEIIQFIGDSILVAHNTSFDVPFLNTIILHLQRPALQNKSLCTNVMTKYLIPEIMSSNLNYMSRIFDIEHSLAHRAIEDAKATAKLLLKYLDIFEAKNIRKINQLYYPRNKFELDRVHFTSNDLNDLNELLKNISTLLSTIETPIIVTIKGENGVILGLLPIKSPHQEIDFIISYIKNFRWNLLQIRLIGPFTEGLFQLNTHLVKIPQNYREKTLTLLKDHYLNKVGENRTEDQITVSKDQADFFELYDFIIVPHLIYGQFILYNLLNFGQKITFKYPSHRKKLFQYMSKQIIHFESNNRKKRSTIQKELKEILRDLFKQYLTEKNLAKKSPAFLGLKVSDVKNDMKKLFKKIDSFHHQAIDDYQFPKKHL